jgi:pyruvate-formate lyase-activating enzyme
MFRCKYCHNPDTIDAENEAAMHWTEDDIMEHLKKETAYF